MAKLQGAEHNKKGRGLEYLYLNVHDEDIDGMFPVQWQKIQMYMG
jgi:dynein light intermediate chain 1